MVRVRECLDFIGDAASADRQAGEAPEYGRFGVRSGVMRALRA